MSELQLKAENARLREIIRFLEMRISAMEKGVDMDLPEDEYDLVILPAPYISPQVSIPGGGF